MKLKNVKVGVRVETKRDYECGSKKGTLGTIVEVDLGGHYQPARVHLDTDEYVWFPHAYLRKVK